MTNYFRISHNKIKLSQIVENVGLLLVVRSIEVVNECFIFIMNNK